MTTKTVRYASLIPLAAASVLLLAGCGSNDNEAPPASTNTAMASMSMPPGTGTGTAAMPTVGKEQAEQTALATVPGGTVASSNLEQDDGRTVWHVHIRDAGGRDYDVDVDAASGAVVPESNDRDENSTSPAMPPAGVTVPKEQAERTAVATVPGGTVVSSEIQQDNGKTVWHVHIRNTQGWDYDVNVDAASGAVVPD